jgi:hypothetical protein
MPVTFIQYGGFLGSHAGDCAILKVATNNGGYCRYIFDLGGRETIAANTYTAAPWLLESIVDGKLVNGQFTDKAIKTFGKNHPNDTFIVFISHFHDDHIARHNAGNIWPALLQLKAHIYYGDAITKVGKEAVDELKTTYAAHEDMLHYLQDGCAPLFTFTSTSSGEKTVSVEIRYIKPDPPEATLDENDVSLGLLIEALIGTTKWCLLSLGDMTADAGNAKVEAMLNARNIGKANNVYLDVVKLAHHGSENNLLPILDSTVNEKTVLLSSGYSQTSFEKLRDKVKNVWKSSEKYFLFGYPKQWFEEKKVIDKKLGDIFGSESLKKLQKDNWTFAERYEKQLHKL